MVERLVGKRKAQDWCLGYRVPAIVVYESGTPENEWCGLPTTVSALNPREYKGPHRQKRGLFLDGPRHDDSHIALILALVRNINTGEIGRVVDVTKKVKMSYGPGL